MTLAAATLTLLLASPVSSPALAPCQGMSRTTTPERVSTLEDRLAAVLRSPRVEVLSAFVHGGWTLLYVAPSDSDETFLFFSKDPLSSDGYVTWWAGAARMDERAFLEEWINRNAPGIPKRLGECFAWYATSGRAGRGGPP